MSALILELKQGESMILNGAVIRFKTRTRIELNTQARFLFGKQIMQQDDAVTLPQQIYYATNRAAPRASPTLATSSNSPAAHPRPTRTHFWAVCSRRLPRGRDLTC